MNINIDKWVRIIPKIDDSESLLDLCKKTDMVPSYVYLIIDAMKKKGLISTAKVGRSMQCRLTDKGASVLDACNKMIKIVDEE